MTEKKITIVGKKSPRMLDMARAAKAYTKIPVDVFFIQKLQVKNIPSMVKKIQGLVIYLGLPGTNKKNRHLFYQKLSQSHTILNSEVGKNTKKKRKEYQQKIVTASGALGIPTFYPTKSSNLQKWIEKHSQLQYPFIIKKKISSRGTHVHLINSFTDLKPFQKQIHHYVFQPYIVNKGDYRVFIIGNKVIDIIKRVAKNGEYRNNISQGASAILVKDKKTIATLSAMAKKVLKIFKYDYGGIDIIYDTQIKKFRFLEMNSMPQWEGLAQATKIDIATKLLDYASTKIT